jgi:hypothetical protein
MSPFDKPAEDRRIAPVIETVEDRTAEQWIEHSTLRRR